MTSLATGPSVSLTAHDVLWETVPCGLALIDKQLRYRRVNARMASIDGVAVEAHVGRTVAETAPGLAPVLEPLLRRVLEAAAGLPGDLLQGGDHALPGIPGQFTLVCSLVTVAPGELPCALLIISETAESRSQLSPARTLLDESQALAELGSWTWDLPSDTILWTKEVYRIFGVTPQAFDGSFAAYMALLPPGEGERMAAIIRRTLETGVPFHTDHRLRRPDGQERVLECRGQATRNAEGQTVRMTGTVLDITERRHTEERLRGQERFVDAILENLPNVLFVKDARDLRFVRFNRAGRNAPRLQP